MNKRTTLQLLEVLASASSRLPSECRSVPFLAHQLIQPEFLLLTQLVVNLFLFFVKLPDENISVRRRGDPLGFAEKPEELSLNDILDLSPGHYGSVDVCRVTSSSISTTWISFSENVLGRFRNLNSRTQFWFW